MTEPMTTGVLEHVDPHALNIEANVRTEASLTKQFIASIKENGVLVPITAVRDADGKLWVRAGQRRTLAAREAGLATVPVYITDADADTATRLAQQITENDQRMALGQVDRVKGIQAMLDTGLSMTKVAKRLAVSAERVKQSKAVAGSPVAMEALHGNVSLAEAAGIAEFEDDPDAVRRLRQAAGKGWFDTELERQRMARAEAEELARVSSAYTDLGYTVLDHYPGYDFANVPLRNLRNADGDEVDESVVTDPRQWSVLLGEESAFYDAEGNKVDETTIDWSIEGDPDGVPAEGMLNPNTITERSEYVPTTYFCRNVDAVGLTIDKRFAKLAEAQAALPEGAPALETSQDLKRKEAEKAERRRVLTMNKAGAAAETARRQFVTGLLKRKTPPDGAATFIAQRLTHDSALLSSY